MGRKRPTFSMSLSPSLSAPISASRSVNLTNSCNIKVNHGSTENLVRRLVVVFRTIKWHNVVHSTGPWASPSLAVACSASACKLRHSVNCCGRERFWKAHAVRSAIEMNKRNKIQYNGSFNNSKFYPIMRIIFFRWVSCEHSQLEIGEPISVHRIHTQCSG